MTCCMSCRYVYIPHFYCSPICFWVLGFDALLYCVCAFESDVYVCMFKENGKLSDFWAVTCKYCPFFVFIFCCSYVSFVLYFCS